jgi:hypothetical protein
VTGVLIGLVLVAAISGALYAERFRQRPPVLQRPPRIVFEKRKQRGIAAYVFCLSGLRRNQLWARVTLHDKERAALADKLATDLRDILVAAGFHRELSDLNRVSKRRLNKMASLLVHDPAFVSACARSLGLLVAGLKHLEGLEKHIKLPRSQHLDALVTDLMNTAIQSLGEGASPQD